MRDFTLDDIRKFNPLSSDHPLVRDGFLCTYCEIAFKTGDVPTLIPMFPTDDPNLAKAQPAHWDCAVQEIEKR